MWEGDTGRSPRGSEPGSVPSRCPPSTAPARPHPAGPAGLRLGGHRRGWLPALPEVGAHASGWSPDPSLQVPRLVPPTSPAPSSRLSALPTLKAPLHSLRSSDGPLCFPLQELPYSVSAAVRPPALPSRPLPPNACVLGNGSSPLVEPCVTITIICVLGCSICLACPLPPALQKGNSWRAGAASALSASAKRRESVPPGPASQTEAGARSAARSQQETTRVGGRSRAHHTRGLGAGSRKRSPWVRHRSVYGFLSLQGEQPAARLPPHPSPSLVLPLLILPPQSSPAGQRGAAGAGRAGESLAVADRGAV